MALTLRARADIAPTADVPAQFGTGDWSLANPATNGKLTLTIINLPDDGGSPITALQYQANGGSWTNLTGTGTGARTISGLPNDVSSSVAIRAVNEIGAGTASATKSATATNTPTPTGTVTNKAEWDAAIAGASSGDIIEVDGVISERVTITGNFAPAGLTIRGSGPDAELSGGIRFQGTCDSVYFNDIKISLPQGEEGSFWSPTSYTTNGLILYSGASITDLVFDGCVIDGGLDSFAEGGRLVDNTSMAIQYTDGFAIRNCTIQRCATAVYVLGSSNGVIEGNDMSGMHMDGVAPQNYNGSCEDLIIRNNHVHSFGCDASNYHGDFFQIQPQNNSDWVRRIYIYGNTYSYGSSPFIAQADPSISRTYNVYSSSFSVPNSESGMETRCAPAGGGSMTVTLPSAAASLGRQFSFRQSGVGTVSFAFNGSDTWVGGTPGMNAVGQWETFVSDGTSQWRKLPRGYRAWFLSCWASRTLSTIEEGFVLNVDATAGDITLTLPAGATTTYRYAIRRVDNSEHTVTLVKGGSDTITLEGVSRTSVTFVQGYSIDIGGTAGSWTATEDKPTNQLVFANAHPQLLYEDIHAFGNIFFNTAGVGFMLGNQDIDGLRCYNNTFVQLLVDDQNGDGVVGPFEGNSGITGTIDIRGTDSQSFNNFTVGQVLITQGAGDGATIGDIALGRSSAIGLESTYATYFNGATRADYRPLTREEVITAALAKSGGPLDGTFIGAVGTTRTNGFYNFETGEVNSSALPAPTVLNYRPLSASVYGPDGAIEVTFDQFIHAGTGDIVLRNKTDNSVIETFNVATGAGDNGGTVSFFRKVLTVTPGANMPNAKDCALRIASTAVLGFYDKAFAGISGDTTFYWTVTNGTPTVYATVVADGDYLRRTSALSGVSTGRQKLLMAWNGLRTGGATQGRIINIVANTTINISALATGELRFNAGTSSFRMPAGFPTSGDPETILVSVDMAAATVDEGVRIYRSGTRLSAFSSYSWVSGTSFAFSGAYSSAILNTSSAGPDQIHGKFGFVYLDFPSALPDLDDINVRAKFRPEQIVASNGNAPTGSQPTIFVTGPASAWNTGTNLGYGGSFTVSGGLADA